MSKSFRVERVFNLSLKPGCEEVSKRPVHWVVTSFTSSPAENNNNSSHCISLSPF